MIKFGCKVVHEKIKEPKFKDIIDCPFQINLEIYFCISPSESKTLIACSFTVSINFIKTGKFNIIAFNRNYQKNIL